jgi:hypothetical protein
METYPENSPRPRLVGVESDAGPDCDGVFEVFLSPNFPKIPDIFDCFLRFKRFLNYTHGFTLRNRKTIALRP